MEAERIGNANVRSTIPVNYSKKWLCWKKSDKNKRKTPEKEDVECFKLWRTQMDIVAKKNSRATGKYKMQHCSRAKDVF